MEHSHKTPLKIFPSGTIKHPANNIGFKNIYKAECFDKNGNLKWEEVIYNTVTNVGLDDVLTNYFKGSAYTATFYVGLIDGSSPSVQVTDTMSSHSSWTENINYSETTRELLVLGTAASQSIDNSLSKASYSINTDAQTIGGIFITDSSTKNGTTGLLYAGGAFLGGDKTVDNGDILNVTITLTASSV